MIDHAGLIKLVSTMIEMPINEMTDASAIYAYARKQEAVIITASGYIKANCPRDIPCMSPDSLFMYDIVGPIVVDQFTGQAIIKQLLDLSAAIAEDNLRLVDLYHESLSEIDDLKIINHTLLKRLVSMPPSL